MLKHRVIPMLLLFEGGLVKTKKFKEPKYVGDPINAIRIFNDKEVDELMVLDISASRNGREPNFGLVKEIAEECFTPLSYGGGITSMAHAETLFRSGVEKISLQSVALSKPEFVTQLVKHFGSQSIVVSIDVKRKLLGRYEVYGDRGTRATGMDPVNLARKMEEIGVGELVLTAIDRDGTMSGYDLELVSKVCKSVKIPVVAAGGAKDLNDMRSAIKQAGASAVAGGAMFVFYGKHDAILINYPSYSLLRAAID